MNTKELKIAVPEGYEIDQESSTFECIKFKPVKKGLPKTWEEFCKTHPDTENEYFITSFSEIRTYTRVTRDSVEDRNLLPSKEYAEAMLALCQLIQLRDCYNDGWTPDWRTAETKYCIEICENTVVQINYSVTSRVLVLKTAELRDQFLKTFRDLIETAKPLL